MPHQPDPASSGPASASPRTALSGDLRTHKQKAPDSNYKWWVLVTVVFGAFASILDSTIVNTALPQIQRVFGADLHLASYVATAYILAAGVVVPASGFLANRFGIKRIYLASLSLFTLGSVLCGAAPNMLTLIAFRVLQGAGGAALFPLSFALLFAAFPQEERGKANGLFGIPVLVAPAIGPTLGGYLTEYVDWRWIFYVNLPVGILGVLLGLRCLRPAPPRPELRFDLPGFLLAGCGLGLLLFGLSNLAYDGLADVRMVSGPIIAALVLLAIFIPFELRRQQPLLHLCPSCRRNFNVVARNVVASLSIAVLTNVLQQRTIYYVSKAGHAPQAILNARALAYHDVFLITAAIVVPAIVLALFLRPSPGRPAVPAGRREGEEAPCDYLERARQEGRAAAR